MTTEVKAAVEKIAPVQGYTPGIPWEMHLRAYDAYCAKWSPQPALIDLAGRNCRGGFSVGELDMFIPGWRDELSERTRLLKEIVDLKDRATKAEAERDAMREALDWFGQNRGLSLQFDWSDADTDGLDWVVYRENGGVNDREWTVIASGPTPQAAILSAYTLSAALVNGEVQTGAKLGPRPNGRGVCKGCPAYETESWREPSGDGETYDSGQYAWCNAADHRSMGSYHYDFTEAPKWCPALVNGEGGE